MKIVFIGYQECPDMKAFPLYNLESGTTVDGNTVIHLGLKIPKTPSYKEWMKQQNKKKGDKK